MTPTLSGSKTPIYGLTGFYCAGKNYIAGELEKRGFIVLDVDKLGWIALEEAREDILRRWGNRMVSPSGLVDRAALGQAVFGRPEELAALEAIVHPEVNARITLWLNEHPDTPKIINAALLHKTNVFLQLDRIIWVKASFLTRLIRAKTRDNLTFRQIFQRFASQKSFSSQYLKKKTDIYTITNEGIGIFYRIFQRSLARKLDNVSKQLV